MNIRYVILAKYAEFTADSTLNMIGGDFDKIETADFPCLIPSVLAAVKIELTPENCGRRYAIVGSVVQPETGEVLGTSDTHELLPFDPSSLGPSSPIELGLVIQIPNVEVAEPGTYEFHVTINDVPQTPKPRLRVGPVGSMRRVFLEKREVQ